MLGTIYKNITTVNKLLLYLFLGLLCGLFIPVFPVNLMWLLLCYYLAIGIIGILKARTVRGLKDNMCLFVVICITIVCFFFTLSFAYRISCEIKNGCYNLNSIKQALFNYVQQNNGCLPPAGQWCDELLRTNNKLSKEQFQIPPINKSECNFAFNSNLERLRLDSIPSDVVVIFMSEGGWNLSGGEELLHDLKSGAYILLADGTITRCRFPGMTIRNRNSKDFELQPLRWNINDIDKENRDGK